MEILDGTSTKGPVRLQFTREEFDALCRVLEAGQGWADTHASKVLRFRRTFADHGEKS